MGLSAVPGFPDLPGAGEEARAVADAWAARGEAVALLIDGEATLAGAAALDLGGFRVVHFAGHGTSVLGAEGRADPFASSLVLADGALDGASLSQLRLRASIVTTAACFSGRRRYLLKRR